jgi:hypothetical protein
LVERFGWNSRRRQLLDGLAETIEHLAAAWLSSALAQWQPWDPVGVDFDLLDPILMGSAVGRATQKNHFGGELLPHVTEARSRLSFSEFFRNERDTGRKGIVVQRLDEQHRDYRATRGHLETFKEAVANLEATTAQQGKTKRLEVELEALRSQVDDLRTEIAEYEELRSGTVLKFEAQSLTELAMLLIKARIAWGWTQRHLADALGVAEQQVQPYESTESAVR